MPYGSWNEKQLFLFSGTSNNEHLSKTVISNQPVENGHCRFLGQVHIKTSIEQQPPVNGSTATSRWSQEKVQFNLFQWSYKSLHNYTTFCVVLMI